MATAPTTALQPGTTSNAVLQLQQYLMSLGLMTQAQINTGPGIYGPQTTAAVKALQTQLGVNNSSGPGFYGPQTIAAVQAKANAQTSQPTSQNSTTAGESSALGNAAQIVQQIQQAVQNGTMTNAQASAALAQVQQGVTSLASTISSQQSGGQTGPQTGSGSSGSSTSTNPLLAGTQPTGNPNLDAATTGIAGSSAVQTLSIPANLQITPQLTQQFLAWAQQVVDPQTQTAINTEVAGINNAVQNLATQFQNTQATDITNYGMQLAQQQNAAAQSGVAQSGLNNLTQQNLAANTNRTLSSLQAQTNSDISSQLQSGGAAIGATGFNGTTAANAFNLPSLTGAQVGITGGQLGGGTGSSSNGNALNFNYNPANYQTGSIPTQNYSDTQNLAANYQNQYGTLAANNTNSQASQLFGMMTNLPAGYSVPAGLT